jgi:hypothetical protein
VTDIRECLGCGSCTGCARPAAVSRKEVLVSVAGDRRSDKGRMWLPCLPGTAGWPRGSRRARTNRWAGKIPRNMVSRLICHRVMEAVAEARPTFFSFLVGLSALMGCSVGRSEGVATAVGSGAIDSAAARSSSIVESPEMAGSAWTTSAVVDSEGAGVAGAASLGCSAEVTASIGVAEGAGDASCDLEAPVSASVEVLGSWLPPVAALVSTAAFDPVVLLLSVGSALTPLSCPPTGTNAGLTVASTGRTALSGAGTGVGDSSMAEVLGAVAQMW